MYTAVMVLHVLKHLYFDFSVPMYNMPYYQQQTQHAAQQYGQHPQMHSQYPQRDFKKI